MRPGCGDMGRSPTALALDAAASVGCMLTACCGLGRPLGQVCCVEAPVKGVEAWREEEAGRQWLPRTLGAMLGQAAYIKKRTEGHQQKP